MGIARLSAGAGYQYLLRDTACGDVRRDVSQPLTAYYVESGYPPGTWWGGGLPGLGDGRQPLPPGAMVTEEGMGRLFGAGRDPVTDAALGRPYPVYRTAAQRIESAVALLPADLDAAQRAAAVESITRIESARRTRSAVAGFDLTFTMPKSASVLWALGDPGTQAAVAGAHRQAVQAALALVEDRALFTRVGVRSCAQVPTRGMVAAQFDHWDTRTGDPNLHTHVVIANKVQGLDGLWRSLDSRALHHATVAVSEVYDNLLADQLARDLPVSLSWRDRGPRRGPAFEIDGIPDPLLAEFSTRSAAITEAMAARLEAFHAEHGRPPTRVETTRIRQHLTLTTRPPKTVQPLPALMAWWRDRATRLLGHTSDHVVSAALGRQPADQRLEPDRPARDGRDDGLRYGPDDTARALGRWRWRRTVRNADRSGWRSADIPDEVVARLAELTVLAVVERRSTFTCWNVLAEAARTTRPIRARSVADRHALHDRVVAAVLQGCLSLNSPALFTTPTVFRRRDGSSVFTRPGQDLFTHPVILAAEFRLLARLDDGGAPACPTHTAVSVSMEPQPARSPSGPDVVLAEDQVDAVATIAASGRRVDVLVGPAGTGKTTTLRALRTVWEQTHGPGSVIGLAPSAAAAHELGLALRIPCDNTAKWLHESTTAQASAAAVRLGELSALKHRARANGDSATVRYCDHAINEVAESAGEWVLRPGQLLIVDEASLAGTLTLDALASQAAQVDAKVLLVGDHHQLSAVDAGGAFGLLAGEPAARELRSLWRFTNRWEALATRRLRLGDPSVLTVYAHHDRITEGSTDQVLDTAYDAWNADVCSGATSLLLAADNTTVTVLNQRAREERIAAGLVTRDRDVPAAGDARVGVGDLVLSRHNDRSLRTTTGGHVRNGTLWTITATHDDGSLDLTHAGTTGGGGDGVAERVRIPAAYVREHVELGYAATVHRAQGVTVAHAHLIATPATTREALYVGMTRGTLSNHVYVPTDALDPDQHTIPDPGTPPPSAAEVLTGVLARSGRERSATETIREHTNAAASPALLLPIRDTLLADPPATDATGVDVDVAMTRIEIEAAIADIDRILHTRPPWPRPDTARVETPSNEATTTARPTHRNEQHDRGGIRR